jgi:hypothetical protein
MTNQTPLEIKLTNGETVRIVTKQYRDWFAVTDNYDLGSPTGHGATRMEAITHLVEQLEDAIEAALDPLKGVDGQFGIGA